MLSRIEVSGFRSLRSVAQRLGPVCVLAGVNGSGKSNFLDAIQFLQSISKDGLRKAFDGRTTNPLELLWQKRPGVIHLAIESTAPENGASTARYGIDIHVDSGPQVLRESIEIHSPGLPPVPLMARTLQHIVTGAPELEWLNKAHLETDRSVLELLFLHPAPDLIDHLDFLLSFQVQPIELVADAMRRPSPSTLRNDPPHKDGGNLPWLVERLQRGQSDLYRRWLEHVRTVFPDIAEIGMRVQDWDNQSYLTIRYNNGLELPSHHISEGTLRLLALTLLAYVPAKSPVYLIEEPENGVHPAALEAIYESLSSVYDGQVLLTTHSPILLSAVAIEEILCFSQDNDGATQIVEGPEHPQLRNWRGEVPLGLQAQAT